MAGRRFRWMLLGELTFDALLVAALVAWGWTLGAAVALAAFLFFGLRALVVANSYGFTLAARRNAPDETDTTAPGPAGWLGMALAESLSLLVLFSLLMPFERWLMAPDRLRPTPGRLPLLLVHGYQCNRGFWFWLRGELERAGWCVATHSLEPEFASIDAHADAIDRRIASVLEATGASQVILVGHSMGGLVARAYLRKHGAARVERIVTLGSPHHGSRMADMAWGENGRQMRIGSPWLQDLARVAVPPGSTSIYSLHDNNVMPQRACSELQGAHNVAIAGVGHLTMALSRRARDALFAALR